MAAERPGVAPGPYARPPLARAGATDVATPVLPTCHVSAARRRRGARRVVVTMCTGQDRWTEQTSRKKFLVRSPGAPSPTRPITRYQTHTPYCRSQRHSSVRHDAVGTSIARRGSRMSGAGMELESTEGARRRTVRRSDTASGLDALPRMSGLDFLRAIRDGELPAAPISSPMLMRLEEVDEDASSSRASPTSPCTTRSGRSTAA